MCAAWVTQFVVCLGIALLARRVAIGHIVITYLFTVQARAPVH